MTTITHPASPWDTRTAHWLEAHGLDPLRVVSITTHPQAMTATIRLIIERRLDITTLPPEETL